MFRSLLGNPLTALDKVARDISIERDVAIDALGHALESQIVNELSKPGRGKYRRSTTKRVGKLGKKGARTSLARADRASAPGDPPAADSGALKRSIMYSKDAHRRQVGSDKEYAAPLEFGTKRAGRKHKTVILPRPFMRPAFEKVRASGLTTEIAGKLRARR